MLAPPPEQDQDGGRKQDRRLRAEQDRHADRQTEQDGTAGSFPLSRNLADAQRQPRGRRPAEEHVRLREGRLAYWRKESRNRGESANTTVVVRDSPVAADRPEDGGGQSDGHRVQHAGGGQNPSQFPNTSHSTASSEGSPGGYFTCRGAPTVKTPASPRRRTGPGPVQRRLRLPVGAGDVRGAGIQQEVQQERDRGRPRCLARSLPYHARHRFRRPRREQVVPPESPSRASRVGPCRAPAPARRRIGQQQAHSADIPTGRNRPAPPGHPDASPGMAACPRAGGRWASPGPLVTRISAGLPREGRGNALGNVRLGAGRAPIGTCHAGPPAEVLGVGRVERPDRRERKGPFGPGFPDGREGRSDVGGKHEDRTTAAESLDTALDRTRACSRGPSMSRTAPYAASRRRRRRGSASPPPRRPAEGPGRRRRCARAGRQGPGAAAARRTGWPVVVVCEALLLHQHCDRGDQGSHGDPDAEGPVAPQRPRQPERQRPASPRRKRGSRTSTLIGTGRKWA